MLSSVRPCVCADVQSGLYISTFTLTGGRGKTKHVRDIHIASTERAGMKCGERPRSAGGRLGGSTRTRCREQRMTYKGVGVGRSGRSVGRRGRKERSVQYRTHACAETQLACGRLGGPARTRCREQRMTYKGVGVGRSGGSVGRRGRTERSVQYRAQACAETQLACPVASWAQNN